MGHSRIDTTKSIYAPFAPKLPEEHSRGVRALLEEPAPSAHTPKTKAQTPAKVLGFAYVENFDRRLVAVSNEWVTVYNRTYAEE